MLRLMRDKFRSLQWILWLVIISFIVFTFVAWGLQGAGPMGGAGGPGQAIAIVDGEIIRNQEFNMRRRSLEDNYRQQLGPQQAAQFIQHPNFAANVLDSMIDRKVACREARRMGLDVTDTELTSYLLRTFVDAGGIFVGREQIKRIAAQNQMSVPEFRANLADDLLYQKFSDLVGAATVITAAEVETEYRRRNDKTIIEYTYLDGATMAAEATFSDAQVEEYYRENGSRFEVGRRSGSYVVVSAADFIGETDVTQDDLHARFDRNSSLYSEHRRARHILLKSAAAQGGPGAIEELEQRARSLLSRVQAGEDFATLASQVSEDQASASNGGDLGYFPRGQMVPEFEEAVFTANPGDIVGPVKTSFGFHIIKLEEIQPERTLADAEVELRAQLVQEKSRIRALETARDALALSSAEGIDAIATKLSRPLLETGLLRADKPPAALPGIGAEHTASLSRELFAISDTAAALREEPVIAGDDVVILALSDVAEPIIPDLEEVRAKVEQALRRSSGKALALIKLGEMSAKIDLATTFSDAAKTVDATATKATLFDYTKVIPGIAASEPAVLRAKELTLNDPPELVEFEDGHMLMHVVEKFEFDPVAFAAAADSIRASLEASRGDESISAFIRHLRSDLEKRQKLSYAQLRPADQQTEALFY